MKIVITGAESTGKSTLTKQLARHYNTDFVKEYARDYVENLERNYTYDDIVKIAKKQIELESISSKKTNKIFFFDTSLIITKVWFEVVYKKTPDWFEQKMQETFANFYLLCTNDLDWVSDNVRENGDKRRDFLFEKYKENLEKHDLSYKIISGTGNQRLENAVLHVNNFLKNNTL